MNKTKEKIDTGNILQNLFKNNWNELFIIDGINNKKYLYQEFFLAILNCKEKLEKFSFKKNDTVCLLMSNSLEMMILYFTCLIMQIIVVPIDPNKSENEIREILSQFKYNAIFCDNNIEFQHENLIYINEFRKEFYKQREISKDQLDVFNEPDYNKLFLITFTSGSTGAVKGVMHSFNNLIRSALAFNKQFNFGKQNVFYHNLPMTYMAGILNLIVLPFISESKIIIGERFNISNVMRFWDIPTRYSVNTFWFIPAILTLLLKFDRGEKGIKYANYTKIIGCVGTASLNDKVKKEFETKYGISLYESYGLSETLFVSTNSPEMPEIEGSVGKILGDVDVNICDDGEIALNVPWMFLGYINIENKDYFEDEKYLTGDIGQFDKNGFLFITGRKKEIIIRGGVNISPKRIEKFLESFDSFEEFCIIGVNDVNIGEKIVCFFVPKKSRYNVELKKILNMNIIEKLGHDYRIDEFVEMDVIPKTINGKVDKLKIEKIYKGK